MSISEIYNEDCMIRMARYPDKWFDLAVVDPPYGINAAENGIGKHTRIKIANGSITGGVWDKTIPEPEYFEQLFRISKHQIICGGNYFPLPTSRGFIIWDKGMGMRGRDFAECEYLWTSINRNAKIFYYDLLADGFERKTKIHPTQKPVALYSWIYHNYLPSGGKVIDTHLGSGSNRIAADKAGNIDFYGWELDKDYFEAQEKRFKEYKSQLVLEL